MKYGTALEHAGAGAKIMRKGWRESGAFVFIVQRDHWNFETDIDGVDELETVEFLCMKTADGHLSPWFASGVDSLADDWEAEHQDLPPIL